MHFREVCGVTETMQCASRQYPFFTQAIRVLRASPRSAHSVSYIKRWSFRMSHKAAMLGAAASLALIASGAEVANAAHFNGWYLGVEGGANWIQDVDAAFRSGPTGGPPTTTIGQNYELNSGWAAFAT